MHNYLSDLNEIQQEAVKYSDGPQLIIAGAGSGKTRVLTYKIVHLLNSGLKASNILSLTFTNKAAKEMKERMTDLTDANKVQQLWMGTFHSIFSRILRIDGDLIGYPSNYTIYDTEDSKKQIKEIIKELKLDPEQYPANEIYGRISKAKNNLLLPGAYENSAEVVKQDVALKRPETAQIYKKYMISCKKASAMDFDDLLVNTNILFRDFPEVLEKYQNLFKYILVDEYQDTNYSQYLILKKLSGAHRKICVVGDDSQSIYAFRGAKIENILNFRNDFNDLEIFKLERNYRSTKNIVNAANSLIEKNENRIPKTIFTDNETGNKVKIVEQFNDKSEAYYVAKTINKIKRNNNYEFLNFAVLYRTNSQSRAFEDAFRRYSIPYKIYGSISFYQRAEIKNIVAYLRLIVNKNDDQALKRIINFPKRGIGNTTIDKLSELADTYSLSVWQVIEKADKLTGVFNSRAITLLNGFKNLMNLLTEKSQELDAKDFINYVLETTGIKKSMAEDRSPEGQSKFENVQEFTNAVQEYFEKKEKESDTEETITLETFLEEIALATDQDTKDDDHNRVSLMTIHASKGLEFKTVFIAGVEEGLFPSYRSVTNPKEIEEERRLFYVAITRGEKDLFITFTKQRMKWGSPQAASPSRFLSEIDEEFIEFENIVQDSEQNFDYNTENYKFALDSTQEKKPEIPKIFSKPKNLKKVNSTPKQEIISKETDEQSGISVGMTVSHAKFGQGKVLKIEGEFPQTKALVEFDSVGQKNLLLKFAKLEVVQK